MLLSLAKTLIDRIIKCDNEKKLRAVFMRADNRRYVRETPVTLLRPKPVYGKNKSLHQVAMTMSWYFYKFSSEKLFIFFLNYVMALEGT